MPVQKTASKTVAKTVLLSLVLLPSLFFGLLHNVKADFDAPDAVVYSTLLSCDYTDPVCQNNASTRDRIENDEDTWLYYHASTEEGTNVIGSTLNIYYFPLSFNVAQLGSEDFNPVTLFGQPALTRDFTDTNLSFLLSPDNEYCPPSSDCGAGIQDPDNPRWGDHGYYFYYFQASCPVVGNPTQTRLCGKSWSLLKVFPKYDHTAESNFVAAEPFLKGGTASFYWKFEKPAVTYPPYTTNGTNYPYQAASYTIKLTQTGPAGYSCEKTYTELEKTVPFSSGASADCANLKYTNPGRYTFKAELLNGTDNKAIATTQSQLDVTEKRGLTSLVWSDTSSSVSNLHDGDPVGATLSWSSNIDSADGETVYLTKSFLGNSEGAIIETIIENRPIAISGTQTISKDSHDGGLNSFWNYDDPGTYYYKLFVKDAADNLVSEANLRLQVASELTNTDVSTLRFIRTPDEACPLGQVTCYTKIVKTIDFGASTSLEYQINTSGADHAWLKQYNASTNILLAAQEIPLSPTSGIISIGPTGNLHYTNAGDYKYELELVSGTEDDLLFKSSAKLIIKEQSLGALYNSKPTAVILASPEGALLKSVPNGTGGYIDPEIYFDASNSYDLYDNTGNFNNATDGAALTYKWDLGDGTADADFSTNAVKQHTYNEVGTYTVTLTVKDLEGQENFTTKEIEVSEPNLPPLNGTATLVQVTDDDSGEIGDINSSEPIEAYVRSEHTYQFQTLHMDQNGWQDLKYVFLKFSDADNEERAVLSLDLNNENSLLWNGTIWEPGEIFAMCEDTTRSGEILSENEYVQILDSTCYTGDNDTLTVNWDLKFVKSDWNEANVKVQIGTIDDWNQSAPSQAQVYFNNIADDAGIEESGTNSVGGSWADIDNDGDLDLYVVNAGSGNKLYRNNGSDSFTDVTGTYGVAGSGRADSWQASFADIDNDGDQDLYVVNHNAQNVLYINNYPLPSFSDKTTAFGVGNYELEHSGASFADYDKDGDLDLFVSSYAKPNSLYRNNYPTASFSDVSNTYSELSNSGDGPATWADYDLDGDPDLYVVGGAAGASNTFWENQGGTRFEEKAAALGLQNTNGHSLVASFADYDNDGKLEIFVSSYDPAYPNRLYKRKSTGLGYEDVATAWGVTDKGSVRQTGTWADYDNDADLDLFVTTYDTVSENRLYQNTGTNFTDVTLSSGITGPANKQSQGQAWADYDNDGDLDLFIANESGANRLYKNNQAEGGNNNSYLKLRLLGGRAQSANGSNRDSVGAIVKLRLGNKTLLQLAGLQTPFSQESSELEFGLGLPAGKSINLEVRWPSGTVKQLTGLTDLNQTLTLSEIDQASFTALSNPAFGKKDSQAITANDFDGDGLQDVVIVNRGTMGEQSYLYLNTGNNKFKEFSVFGKSLGGAVNVADLDNDGDLDVALGANGIDYVYRNEGDQLFTEIALPDSKGNTFAIIPFDANGDQRLDLALLNADGLGNPLYLNSKDSLEDYALKNSAFGNYRASAACVADYDKDGDTDLALAVYGGTNVLFENDSKGIFVEKKILGNAKGNYSSCAWGDYDNDSDLDIAFAGLEGTALQVFENTSGAFSVKYTSQEINDVMGLVWADFNNDGYLDLATNATTGQNLLYLSDAGKNFTATPWLNEKVSVPAMTVADFDNDGDLDIAAAHNTQNSTIYLNDLNNKNFLKVNLIGLRAKDNGLSNRAALGAKLELRHTGLSPLVAYRELFANSGRSNLGFNPLFWGLDASQSYELKITFPAGTVVDKKVNPLLGKIIPQNVKSVLAIDEAGNVSGL